MANPTTNYGFVLPTSSDLVTDLPADFDVALQGVDTRLKALQPGTTLGDLAYSSATANTNTRLGIGSTGQVLKVVGGVPAWSADSGKVLQVVNATTTTEASSATSTYVDSNLTATITPTSATSTILVIVSLNLSKVNNSYIKTRLLRGATSILEAVDTESGYTADSSWNNIGSSGFSYLDSPATTSATTYKMQLASVSSVATVYAQRQNSRSTITLMEIGA